MQIELRPVDAADKTIVEQLTVADDQKQFIASNQDSLKTADREKAVARPFAICADGVPVGFSETGERNGEEIVFG